MTARPDPLTGKRPRTSFSVSGAFWRHLEAHATRLGRLPRDIVREALADLSTVDPDRVRKCEPMTEAVPVRIAAPAPTTAPRFRPVIDVDEGTVSMLDDLVKREAQLHGRRVTDGDLLDAAIVRFLDAMRWP